MPGRGDSLLRITARGFRAAAQATDNAAAPFARAAQSQVPTAASSFSSTAASAPAAEAIAGTPRDAVRLIWTHGASYGTPKGATAVASAIAGTLDALGVPWVGHGPVRPWSSGSSVAAAAAAGPGHGPIRILWDRTGNNLAVAWRRRTVYGASGWRAADGSSAAAAAAGAGAAAVDGASQGLSRRPLGLLTASGRRLMAPMVPPGMAAAAAAAAAGTAAVAASGQWAPLAGASTVRSIWRDSRGYEHFHGRGHAWSPHNPRLMYGTAAMAAAALAYYLYSLETVPYTGRRHAIMLVSPYREQWMGKMGFEQFKAVARAEHKLLPDAHPDVQRVAQLGRAIAAVAADGGGGGNYEHMRGLQWEFAVINDGMVNAAVLPGGKVIVFSGLLRLLEGNDDELAAVMAHEVGHVLARHPAENMSTLNVWLLLNTALRLTLGFKLPDVAMYLALVLPNSRKNEHEADVIGLRLMARACFDPSAAPSMLDKLNRAEQESKQRRVLGASLPPFLSTHPLTTERVKLLEKDLAQAYKLFDESGCASLRSDLRRGLDAWLGGGWGGL